MAFDLSVTLQRSHAGTGALLAGLEEIRKQVILEKEALAAILERPVDLETALARLDAWLEKAASDDVVKDFARRLTASSYREPMPRDSAHLFFVAVASSVRSVVERQMERDFAAVPGLSENERHAALAARRGVILQLELAEEATIRAAEKAGIDLLRRADADVRAVLAADDDLQVISAKKGPSA